MATPTFSGALRVCYATRYSSTPLNI